MASLKRLKLVQRSSPQQHIDAALRIVSLQGFQPLPLNKILSASTSVIITVMGSTGEAMNP